MCCDSWGHKELDTTEQLNRTKLNRINNKSVSKTNILIYRFSTRYIKHVTLRRQLRKSGVGFPTPGSYLVCTIMNCPLWTCSKSLMPYSIQFINNYNFLLWPLPEPAFLFFFLSPIVGEDS